LFNLCLAGVGGPYSAHPDLLETVLTADQIAEWEAFNVLEPIGGYKQDFRFSQLCVLVYVLAHAYGGKRVDSKIEDFMPWWFTQYLKKHGPRAERQPIDQMKANLLSWARLHNRNLERKQGKGEK